MTAFQSPNYTQTPNDFFAMLPDMSEAELRVTIVMIRHTFGFHRNGFKMGMRKLAEASGLSGQGARNGAEAAEKRGTFRRSNPDSQGEAEWELIVVDPLNVVEGGVNVVEAPPQRSRGQVAVKESIKKELNKSEVSEITNSANQTVDAILEGERQSVSRINYPKRESLPEPIRDLIDAFVDQTKIKPLAKEIFGWLSVGSDWLSFGATPQAIRDAITFAEKKGISILTPYSLTNTLRAHVAKAHKTDEQRGEYHLGEGEYL